VERGKDAGGNVKLLCNLAEKLQHIAVRYSSGGHRSVVERLFAMLSILGYGSRIVISDGVAKYHCIVNDSGKA
jgi:beta-phosphoglucomutase-like phosphatase (HAD superfamily)